MNGTENQIRCAEKIISDFITKCENVKIELAERIESYNRRSAKTGRSFSGHIADTKAGVTAVDQAIEVAKRATNAKMVIDLRHILEKSTANTEWDNLLLNSIKLILKEGKI